jgi:hypothetical protein
MNTSFLKFEAKSIVPLSANELLLMDRWVKSLFYDVRLEVIFVGLDEIDVE